MSNIRVILSTGSLWLTDTAYVFELAAEAGYDGIEIMCDERYTTRLPEYLQRLSTDHGLPIPVLHTPFSQKMPGWGKSDTELERVQHTIKLAEEMGAERIVVHLPFKVGRALFKTASGTTLLPWINETADFKVWMEKGGLAQLQSETAVQIGMENMPAKKLFGKARNLAYWNTIEEWSKVHDHLTLDTTHWGTFGIDPIVPLRAAGERVKHIHLSNFDGREHRLPQSGDLDLGAFLREVALMNLTETTVSIELHPDALAFDTPKATRRKLRETLDFCREHLNG